MQMITEEQLNTLRLAFPVGSRVQLLKMEDVQAPPVGTEGTVRGIDSTGSIMVSWDTGSSLNVLYDTDLCRVCPTLTPSLY